MKRWTPKDDAAIALVTHTHPEGWKRKDQVSFLAQALHCSESAVYARMVSRGLTQGLQRTREHHHNDAVLLILPQGLFMTVTDACAMESSRIRDRFRLEE